MLKKVLESMIPHPKYKVTRLDESTITERQYAAFSDWDAAAKHQGLAVKAMTHPRTGDADQYWVAKDKEGNEKGHFDKLADSKSQGVIEESPKDYLSLANAAKKKAISAADRDEQELYVKHMIAYHTNMAKHDPKNAGKHKEKIRAYKADINESVVNEGDAPYHRVAVTVSDPNHTMVSKRKETMQKFVRVKGDKSEAVEKAKAHFKKKGYKVHSAEYVEGYAIPMKENVINEAGRSKKEINQDINATELEIHDIWRDGGTVSADHPLNKKLRDLKAERKRADFKVVEGSRVDARINDASERGENIPSNIDPNPKKVDPDVAAAKIKKLKAKISVLKVKLAVAKKASKPDERVILGLENDIDIADGQIQQLSK